MYDRKVVAMKNFLTFFDIKQHNCIYNCTNRLLDLVCTDLKCEILHNETPLVPEDSYHPSLIIDISTSIQYTNFSANTSQKSYNFKKANYQALYNDLLNTDWYVLQNFNDVDSALDEFYSKFYSILDLHVPQYNYRSQCYPKWYSKEIITNIKKKKQTSLLL